MCGYTVKSIKCSKLIFAENGYNRYCLQALALVTKLTV